MRQKLASLGEVMQNVSFYNKLNYTQEKDFGLSVGDGRIYASTY